MRSAPTYRHCYCRKHIVPRRFELHSHFCIWEPLPTHLKTKHSQSSTGSYDTQGTTSTTTALQLEHCRRLMQYKNTTQTIDRNVNELSEEDDHSQGNCLHTWSKCLGYPYAALQWLQFLILLAECLCRQKGMIFFRFRIVFTVSCILLYLKAWVLYKML